MPQEIERKFLVRTDGWKSNIQRTLNIAQGYLSTDPERTVRIRVQGAEAFLTIKGKGEGISRPEFEYPIPVAEAQECLLLCQSPPLIKTRYEVDHAGKIWEVDVFAGKNEGLVLAEIELESVDESIELPPWVGEEVSGDERFYNAYLSKRPYIHW